MQLVGVVVRDRQALPSRFVSPTDIALLIVDEKQFLGKNVSTEASTNNA